MRLLSLIVRNYRVHREVTVAFDGARTLLGGPNQSGKSTLAEAAHRVLFLRAKTGGSIQLEMISKLHHEMPEVALSFEARGATWQIEKRFAGAKGTARLTGPNGVVLKDDEAETKLSELLGSEIAGGRGGAKLSTLWSHLWVWQGSSGDDPGEHAGRHKDTLVRRLQEDGVAAVMQSGLDRQVRDRIAAEYLALFTPASGKLKATSPPELARADFEKATEAVAKANEAMARLEAATTEHGAAAQQLGEAEAALPGLRTGLTEVAAKLEEVAALRAKEENAKRAWEAAAASLKQLSGHDARIRELHQQAAAAREKLQPAEAAEARLLTADQDAEKRAREAEQDLRDKSGAIRTARQLHDFHAAAVAVFEKEEAQRRLAERAKEADALVNERQALQERLAKLPPLAPQDIRNLRKLDQEAGQARAALKAIAAGIELISGDLPVELNGKPLAPGKSRILTDTAELVIGGSTRLRILPGGGTSLGEARSRDQRAQQAFAAALARFGVADLDAAVASAEQRQDITQQIAQLDVRWKAMGGEAVATELAAAVSAASLAKAELERHRAALATPPVDPASPEAARQSLATQRNELQEAERREAAARRAEEQARVQRETSSQALAAHRLQITQDRQALRDLETTIQVMESSHGDATARDATLRDARNLGQEAAGHLESVRKALAELSPELLAADRERLQRAIDRQEQNRRAAQDRQLTASTVLRLDGSSDPQAELQHAMARQEAARLDHEFKLRHAKAIELLHKLFASSGEAIDRSLVQPLADRASVYLQALYGSGASLQIALTDDGKAELELLRAGQPAFGFATLSGGAREQVAAALRLAMAEILAADHDGCLPLVFDDAFAYADPEKVQLLQRMLDLAASRGLQVIVLACNPADYSALGAAEIRLLPPA